LRDLHRLAIGPIPDTTNDWEQRMYARFARLPDQAQPLQRSQLMAAFSVGTKIIRLRQLCHQSGPSLDLDAALEAVARGNCAMANAELGKLDAALAAVPGETALRARGLILAISYSLSQHAAYFEAGAPA
jgi:hypothetical protein